MADLLNPEILGVVLFYVVPGFIATTFYRFVIPSENRNLGDSLIEFLGFSMFYLALFFSLIKFINRPDIRSVEGLYDISTFFVVFIIPALPGYIIARIRQSNLFNKLHGAKLIDPTPTPWDYVFREGQRYMIVCHLKSKEVIAGLYADDSCTSAFPNSQEIYIQQIWQYDKASHQFT